MPMHIVVASKNPVKIRAVERGIKAVFPDRQLQVTGFSVPSEVSDQPMDDAETKQGAVNRVRNVALLQPNADLFVAIEGGCAFETDSRNQEYLSAFAWVVLKDKHDLWGEARSASFQLPDAVAVLVRDGKELGEADDIVFAKINSKQDNGAVGLLTANAVTREDLYVMPVILALNKIKNIERVYS